MWSIRWDAHVPAVIAAYLSSSSGSLFPLFPWLAYGAFGAALSAWFVMYDSASPGRRACRTLLPAGLTLSCMALLFRALEWEPIGSATLGAARVSQFLLQAGLVCLLLTLVAVLFASVPRRAGFVQALSRHSLLVYVVHICAIYGSPGNLGLRHIYGRTLSPLAVAACVAMLWLSMAMVSQGWSSCCQKHQVLASRLRLASFCIVAGSLLI
jgi:fucose 4-O-acetylase-like acetyltransferase